MSDVFFDLPQVELRIFRCKWEAWELFRNHHYLSSNLNRAAKCFLVTWNEVPVAFTGVLALPSPTRKKCWRASRTVVLPDYQGLGIGVRLSDYIGSMVRAGGGYYYSKTIHPAMIAYRLKGNKWRETSHSRQRRSAVTPGNRSWTISDRYCYAFEYVGPAASEEDSKLFSSDTDDSVFPELMEMSKDLDARGKSILRKRLSRLRKKQERMQREKIDTGRKSRKLKEL